MKSSPAPKASGIVVAFIACAASVATMLTACSSSADPSPSSKTSVSPQPFTDPFQRPTPPPTTVPAGCPTAAAAKGAAPEWTLTGATGSVAVTGPTDTVAPLVTVTSPFSVNETRVHTLTAGDGPVVAATAKVSVCYLGVNGRDGSVFDSSFERGTPVDFPLTGVVPGFQKAIAGQKVGSTVAVAMSPVDGYPQGQPSAGIRPGDSLIFAIKILSASS